MLLQKILTLYPDALLNNMPDSFEDYLELTVQSNKLYIPHRVLDNKSITLLQLLTDTPSTLPDVTGTDYAWQQFLVNQSPLYSTHTKIRFLYIRLPLEQSTFDRKLWSSTLSSASQNVIANLPLDTRYQLLVLKGELTTDTLINEFSGLLNSLNSDFDLQIFAYLGQLYTVEASLPEQFQQEHSIITSITDNEPRATILPITVAILQTIGHNSSQRYPLLAQLKQVIAHSAEYSATIQALVEHQGNLTHAADKLFIHRNTLTYRINKFAKETGLNLQYLPDLMLCYLAL